VTLGKAEVSDIPEILAHVRLMPDVEQVTEDALGVNLEKSTQAWVAHYEGEVAAMWGLYRPNLMVDTAFLWMVTTKLVEKHPFLMARYGRILIDTMMLNHSSIYGVVHPDYERSHRWLRFLRFEILEPSWINGKLVRPFIRRK
jgi:hypothetical protein